jgi:hypothetical protein
VPDILNFVRVRLWWKIPNTRKTWNARKKFREVGKSGWVMVFISFYITTPDSFWIILDKINTSCRISSGSYGTRTTEFPAHLSSASCSLSLFLCLFSNKVIETQNKIIYINAWPYNTSAFIFTNSQYEWEEFIPIILLTKYISFDLSPFWSLKNLWQRISILPKFYWFMSHFREETIVINMEILLGLKWYREVSHLFGKKWFLGFTDHKILFALYF